MGAVLAKGLFYALWPFTPVVWIEAAIFICLYLIGWLGFVHGIFGDNLTTSGKVQCMFCSLCLMPQFVIFGFFIYKGMIGRLFFDPKFFVAWIIGVYGLTAVIMVPWMLSIADKETIPEPFGDDSEIKILRDQNTDFDIDTD